LLKNFLYISGANIGDFSRLANAIEKKINVFYELFYTELRDSEIVI